MLSDSSSPIKPRSRVEAIPIAIQTLALGLLLYLVPPTIAAVVLIGVLQLTGMSDGQVSEWLQNVTLGQFLYVLITEVIVVSMLYFLVRHAKLRLKDIGMARPRLADSRYIMLGLIVYFTAYIAVATAVAVFTNIDLEQEQEIGFNTNVAGFNLVLAGISLIVLPPIVEEILFRGYLYNRFRQAFSVIGAGLLVSLLFGVAHLQIGTGNIPLWIAAIDTFILSVVLVYIREKTGTIWPGVFIHAFKNAIAFVILFNIFS
jgi:uncharacterized protein